MQYFVVEHDRRAQSSTWREFSELAAALEALRTAERDRDAHVEVVLFSARSLDDLRRTHSRFFMNTHELIARFGDELRQMPA